MMYNFSRQIPRTLAFSPSASSSVTRRSSTWPRRAICIQMHFAILAWYEVGLHFLHIYFNYDGLLSLQSDTPPVSLQALLSLRPLCQQVWPPLPVRRQLHRFVTVFYCIEPCTLIIHHLARNGLTFSRRKESRVLHVLSFLFADRDSVFPCPQLPM